MPRPTAADLRAAATEARDEAARLRLQAAALEVYADTLEEAAAKAPLTTDDTDDTIRPMNVGTQAKNESVRRAIGRATRKHPAQVAIYKAGLTLGQLAKELGEGRSRVSSWMSDDPEALRPIPRQHAETLRAKYRIPLSAWRRIAD